ncbi:class I SAM-dependent methyltransferase [Desulfocicer niacini]
MNLFPLKNKDTWKELWKNVLKNDPEKKPDRDHIKNWDQRAQGFAKRVDSPEAVLRKERIFSMLKDAGAFEAGTRVLDIGAGPGSWAIPMVEAGATVTALEPSAGMVEILKEKMAEKGIGSDRICIDQRAWQDVDVEKEGLSGQFDLVFASMSPGVNDPETLDKAMRASRKFCYLSTFSGGGMRDGYNNLWQNVTGRELETVSWDFIYPFSYVYALGYRPRTDFITWSISRKEPIDEAVDNIIFFVRGAEDVTPEIREKVIAYVTEHAVNGFFHQEHTICQGIMLWQIA